MGVIKKTLVIEDILSSHFDMLPPFEKEVGGVTIEFSPFFKVGDDKELLAFIKEKETKPYPLIWLMRPFSEDHKTTFVSCDDLSFVLAVESNTEEYDSDRLESSYKAILLPLLDNIKKIFRISASIDFNNNNVKITKFPNYGEDNENEFSSIWDALKVTFESLSFKDKCIKQINI